ncbi:putative metalloprotein [Sulfurospirillum diekertiae]|uniref:Metalloprotein n=1 Tax=Sulfurospirillum diekertiae TaxID=1854492 RepID=A0A290HU59_9BACT|nr:VOC family protein [Sulfurospirillum diekertiae]ATB69366.1 putative metalloprotein [Sulfurospirillum diekertiae]
MKPYMSMITLGVSDMAKSIAFYQKGLGFPYEENIAFFTLNGTWLALYEKKALAEDANVTFDESTFHGVTLAHMLGSEAEVDELFQEAIKAGATPTKQPQKVFWGGYSGYFKDPDSHLWEIAHNPFFTIETHA